MSVLIIADPNDPGVDSVLDWIEYLNIDYKIINFGHLLENLIIETQISSKNNTDIQNSVIQANNLKVNWNITKDKDKIFKEFQYRYMCLDFNDYIYSTTSRTEQCDFNPFLYKWKIEIGYKPLFN